MQKTINKGLFLESDAGTSFLDEVGEIPLDLQPKLLLALALPVSVGRVLLLITALLSGALLNCAFLGIYKTHVLMKVAGLGAFFGNVLIGFGLFSMMVGAIFIISQPDYKRMLAYSSIKNMGIIAFGAGIGGFALYGTFLHIIHHSLLKSSLFLFAHIQVAAGAGRIFMSMSYGEAGEKLQIREKTFRLLPSYALLLASVYLCIWMPDFVYNTIQDSIVVIGGITHG